MRNPRIMARVSHARRQPSRQFRQRRALHHLDPRSRQRRLPAAQPLPLRLAAGQQQIQRRRFQISIAAIPATSPPASSCSRCRCPDAPPATAPSRRRFKRLRTSSRGTASASKIASRSSGFKKTSVACTPSRVVRPMRPRDELRPRCNGPRSFGKSRPGRTKLRYDQVELRESNPPGPPPVPVPRKKSASAPRLDGLHPLPSPPASASCAMCGYPSTSRGRLGNCRRNAAQHRQRQDEITDRAAANHQHLALRPDSRCQHVEFSPPLGKRPQVDPASSGKP